MKFFKKLLLISLLPAAIAFFGLFYAQGEVFAGSIDTWGGQEANFAARSGLGTTDPRVMAGRIINFALGFLGIIAVALIMYAGWVIMRANGEEAEVRKGKKILIYAAGGLVIILMSFAIATFVLRLLIGATTGTGTGTGCTDGDTRNCAFSAVVQTCVGGVWTPDCGGGTPPPVDCFSCGFTDPVCDAIGPNWFCASNCTCRMGGGVGDACSASTTPSVCDADATMCREGLYCEEDDPMTLCTCQGSPIIDLVSPQGGFCRDAANAPTDTACLDNDDCAAIPSGSCDVVTPNGREGNFVTIEGRFFGDATGTVQFSADGWTTSVSASLAGAANPACAADAWRDDRIVAIVPNGLAVGPGTQIRVTAARSASSTDTTGDDGRGPIMDFVVNGIQRPGLCSMSPESGVMGTPVNYDGINFAGNVYFGNSLNHIRAGNSVIANPNNASGEVPNLSTGYVTSFIMNNRAFSNYLTFRKLPEFRDDHYITRFNPLRGGEGQYVTIFGRGLGSTGAAGLGVTHKVFFDNSLLGNNIDDETTLGTLADFSFPEECDRDGLWRNDRIIVKVPDNIPANGDYFLVIKSGSLTELIDSGDVANAQAYGLSPTFAYDSALPPTPGLCRISPEMQMNGYPVDLYGEYFGDQADGSVRFHLNRTVPGGGAFSWDNTSITNRASLDVPAQAITGDVVLLSGATSSNGIGLTVGSCLDANDPSVACGGDICCAANTPMSGRCAASNDDCFGNINSSVYEWNFNNLGGGGGEGDPCDNDLNDITCNADDTMCNPGLVCNTTFCICEPGADVEACADRNADQCVQSESCPNSPGSCSVGNSIPTSCDIADYPRLDQNYAYDDALDRFANSADICSRDENQGELAEINAYCAAVGGNHYWQYDPRGQSCRDGFIREVNGRCTLREECSLCPSGRVCMDNGAEDNAGICAYPREVCPGDTVCDAATGDCSNVDPECDCCCSIGSGNQQCCAGLTCEGECGSDLITDNDEYGKCTGCTVVVDGTPDQDRSDAACNCPGTTGKYCDMNAAGGLGTCNDCAGIDNAMACSDHSSVCCYDETGASCRGGVGDFSLPSGDGFTAYCSYYTCDTASDTCEGSADTTGENDNLAECNRECRSTTVGGSCETLGVCQYDICGELACFTEEPAPACGYCCCDMTLSGNDLGSANPDMCKNINSKLFCDWTDDEDTNCQDPSRGAVPDFGICCGCSSDGECGDPDNVGCGSDECCHPRPRVVDTVPAHGTTNVCRNAAIEVEFDTLMSPGSFPGNIIVFGDYGGGTCPAGTRFLSDAGHDIPRKGFFGKLVDRLEVIIGRIIALLPGQEGAYAQYASDHVFCSVEGTFAGYSDSSGNGFATFKPMNILDPSRTYYIVVVGDENGSSTLGVKNRYGISMGATNLGLLENDLDLDGGIDADDKMFNGKIYHAYVSSFTTLPDARDQGICRLDHVKVSPSSYLFQTVKNELAENDYDPTHPTFDAYKDTDKVFMARALASNEQIIATTSQYSWTWTWSSTNNSVAEVLTSVEVPGMGARPIGLPANFAFLRATSTAVDGRTELWANATIDIDSVFIPTTLGESRSAKADVYVFLCDNPWPPIAPDGTWRPWIDSAGNCDINPAGCNNTNYELYYCRDSGKKGTYDDLPAINNDAVVRSQSDVYNCNGGFYNTVKFDNGNCDGGATVCAVERTAGDRVVCEGVCKRYGSDGKMIEKGGFCKGVSDCLSVGRCDRSNLKEAYYFRNALPDIRGAEASFIATSSLAGGSANLGWAATGTADRYRLYWDSRSGGRANYADIWLSGADTVTNDSRLDCTYGGSIFTCNLNGLANGSQYFFNVTSVNSVGATESAFYSQADIAVTVRDLLPPDPPVITDAIVGNRRITLSWQATSSASYVIRYGTSPGSYGSMVRSSEKSAAVEGLTSGTTYYFVVEALDLSRNISDQSVMRSAIPE